MILRQRELYWERIDFSDRHVSLASGLSGQKTQKGKLKFHFPNACAYQGYREGSVPSNNYNITKATSFVGIYKK
jgi:hypothetical protein